MKILVDTHVFLWMLSCPEKLNVKRRYDLESPANEVFLSSISIAELMIKSSIGEIDIDFDPLETAKQMQVEILDFSGTHAAALGQLPLHHKDPFDRMILAQAMTNKLLLMTEDQKFSAYDCSII
ncbi:MAG: type II toxin-antitoxin system VapC family toxin [Desulfobacteraceae bacterium]|nr:type II toxin-antitoxin system VapC family toxin [Desulfobacteraceae bacterium]